MSSKEQERHKNLQKSDNYTKIQMFWVVGHGYFHENFKIQ